MNWGHVSSYAPAVETTDGRFLAYGWSWEGLTEQGREEQGWAGCLTLFDDADGLVQVTGSGLSAGQQTVVPAL
jgi:hypothetical protein